MSKSDATKRNGGKSDTESILYALRLILATGQVTELRALDAVTGTDRRPHVEAGYFDDQEKLARAAANISHAKGIYFVPNPVNPALLARAVNKVRPAPRGESTQDGDILGRRWLLIDTDPVRPSGISSNDEEHAVALRRAEEIAEALTAERWPSPILADSGNGGHLLYRIDLPADDGGLVHRCLDALAARFDDAVVKIDRTVFNPSRIWKLYGTIAGKGDAEAEALGRPHRLARILTAPDAPTVVPRELLEALAATAPQPLTSERGRSRQRTATPPCADLPADSFDVAAWLREHNLDADGPEDWHSKDGQAGRRWVFGHCPWNSEHTDRSAYVVQFASGAIAAGCHHNGCSGNDWHALRDLMEPGWREKRKGKAGKGASVEMGPAEIEALLDFISAVGGGNKILDDADLMSDLARMSALDPLAYARARGRCADQNVRLRDFDRAIKHLREKFIRETPPPAGAAGPYQVTDGRIIYLKPIQAGAVPVLLADFSARITEQIVIDDGAEQRRTLAIEGQLADGRLLPRIAVAAEKFGWMRWPVEVWGPRAVVYAGAGIADHLRAAVQLLSGDVPTRITYAHTGWRDTGGRWVYLHGGGALGLSGEQGVFAGAEVALPDALANYILPNPPTGAELTTAIRASLAILDLASNSITAALLGAVYRAVLGSADYGLHLAGPTGTGKTELAALCQQHWGSGLDARHLPGSWTSTGNSLEGIAFAAKDALLVVDDFAPGGSSADVARQHREADRLLRAQGNRSGRQRMRADGSLRPARPPRGTILSTGEDVPRGHSLRARLLILELGPGELDWARLNDCQRAAAAGLFAQALSGFVKWLAPRYSAIRVGLATETAALRERVRAEELHARLPGIVADLATGWHYWLDYALEASAIGVAERDALARRVWQALLAAAARQAEHVEAADPCCHFLRLLAGSLASGRGHVDGVDGQAPENSHAWGWRTITIGTGQHQRDEWQPQGRCIGWLDGDNLYLEPEASYAEAQELARNQGDSLPVQPRTLWRRLRERNLLVNWDASRQRCTIRRTLGGVRHREVIHLRADSISSCAKTSTPSTNGSETQYMAEKMDGPVDGCAAQGPNRPQEPSTELKDSLGQDSHVDGVDGVDGLAQTERGEKEKKRTWYAAGCEGLRTPFDEGK
jgi:hypothetical protein